MSLPNFHKLIFVVLGMLYLALVATRYIEFVAWSQVTAMWSYNIDWIAWSSHPHFYRFLAAYPGLYMTHWYNDEFFSIYICLCMFVTLTLIFKIVRKSRAPTVVFYIAFVVVCGSHLLMNGRGALSWLGWAIIIASLLMGKERVFFANILFISVGLLFTSVSSGTFFVGFTCIFISLVISVIKSEYNPLFWAKLLPCAVFIPYYYSVVFKNLSYFAFENKNIVEKMLEHGVGPIIDDYPIILWALFIILLFSPFIINFMLKRFSVTQISILALPIVGGAFGITTLTLVVVSVLAVVLPRFTLARGR